MSSTCADATRLAKEAPAGTAPTARGWVCVEQGGAWGRKAERESGLDPEVAAHLSGAVEDLPVRLQLIRRPRRQARATPGAMDRVAQRRTVLLAHAGPQPWLEELEVDDVRMLLALDPSVCDSPTPPGLGRRVDEPRYLVCTHAKRDRCCATYGRPIADTLAALHPHRTWEVSHVGGHRFAANLLVLPYGTVHGGLDVAAAVRVVDLLAAGRLELSTARGRSGLPRPAQAAELLVRERLGLDHLDAVVVDGVADLGDDRAEVGLRAEGTDFVAEVVREPTGVPRPLSCDSDDAEDPGVYRLVALTPAGDR
ncbi:sucrase ferredoxin [Egicoccus sp. AB-alg6-2]|uniref:sucrase ferredoxin n=1 Tax=Egicoccus sp. AB-alg6-2 TaxID=3242692 RepID=UPI00359E5FA3